MPGPPPTPFRLRVLRGNPSRRPLRPEPAPSVPPDTPEPPEFLTGYACDEWHRVVPELHALRLLTALDVQPLAAYCEAYKRWRTAEELLETMAAKDAVTNGLLIKRTDGNAAQIRSLGSRPMPPRPWSSLLAISVCRRPRALASRRAWPTSRPENSTGCLAATRRPDKKAPALRSGGGETFNQPMVAVDGAEHTPGVEIRTAARASRHAAAKTFRRRIDRRDDCQ